jgi:hypothetical protein
MRTPCFIKKGTNPPVCGVHGVLLVRHESLETLVVARFGDFIFLKCPMSGQVVDEAATHE